MTRLPARVAVAVASVLALLLLRPLHAQVGAADDQAAQASARELSQAFAAVARTVKPAVVNISTTTVIPGRVSPWLREFFGPGFGDLLRPPDREVHSLGSGCLISAEGHIVTNNHVVAGAQQITVTLADERELAGTIVGCDPATDLAVVRIDATGLPWLRWGDSDALQVGEWVLAVGSPFGLSHTVTAGIISAKGRSETGIAGYEDLIQTDAAINPGNSGGPLVNLAAELVGINTAIASQSGGSVGIGFAVPSALARNVARQLIANGEVVRGWIGVLPRELSPELVKRYGLGTNTGVFVEGVYRAGPAGRAGILPGTVITRWGDVPVTSVSQLAHLVAQTPVGTTVTVGWMEGTQARTASVTVMRQPLARDGRPVKGI